MNLLTSFARSVCVTYHKGDSDKMLSEWLSWIGYLELVMQ